MSNHIQYVMYEGFTAAEPEMRYMADGKAVTNFRMGSTRQWKNKAGEVVKETTWLKVSCWGSLAEIVGKYVGKGKEGHVIVTGTLRVGPDGSPVVYEKKDGTSAASFEITAKEVRILSGRNGEASSAVEEEIMPF